MRTIKSPVIDLAGDSALSSSDFPALDPNRDVTFFPSDFAGSNYVERGQMPNSQNEGGATLGDLVFPSYQLEDTSAEVSHTYTEMSEPELLSREPPRENELRYLMPRSLAKTLDLDTLPSKEIVQHYCAADRVQEIVQAFDLAAKYDLRNGISNVRIRNTDGNEFSLDFKSPKAKDKENVGAKDKKNVGRDEISIPINKAMFNLLLPHFQAGTQVKTRYLKAGEAYGPEGETIQLTAEIDVIKKLGNPPQKVKPNFVTVDIELPDTSVEELMRDGRHTFTFLKNAVELNELPKEERDLLSNRRLAMNGISKAAQRQVDTILAQSHQPAGDSKTKEASTQ